MGGGTIDSIVRYVIDALTLLHLVDGGLHVDPSHQLVAPHTIRSEALEFLLRDVRDGTRTEKAAREAQERLTRLSMRLLGDRASRGLAWRIARHDDRTTIRDAEYLAVTLLQADALVTVDPDLTARAQGVVEVAPLQALLASE